MSAATTLESLDLAALLCSRVCHDLISPAGAIVNGLARGFIEDDKVKLAWNVPRVLLPKNRVKLALNMLVVASQAIPRGGSLTVESSGSEAEMTFKIVAKGLNARIAQSVPDLLAGSPASGTVDAHAIQPFYTGLLARHCGLAVTIEAEGDAIVVAAR